MLTKNIKFKNFIIKGNNQKIKKFFLQLLKDKLKLLEPLKKNYKYNYPKKLISKLDKYSNINIIGMGGSILGAEAIYDFLKNNSKKKITFINNLNNNANYLKDKKKKLNIIISKSGDTLETITNVNIIIKKKDKNIFITENKNSYLKNLAHKLKAEIIEHKNFIGGRYSVLSEVGMLPAEIIGLNEKNFKQFDNLIKSNKFINDLINNVSSKIELLKKGKYTSVILNYDERSENFFKWYQQLVAESLGKKSKGILPVISNMPKDNHSLMQLYLDGPKKNFFTFFYVFNDKKIFVNNKEILSSHNFLKNKDIDKIIFAQKLATEKIFRKKNIPFRSFEIIRRNEQSMGELFTFFILETILLGRALKINPFDQPSVELIKNETKKILI